MGVALKPMPPAGAGTGEGVTGPGTAETVAVEAPASVEDAWRFAGTANATAAEEIIVMQDEKRMLVLAAKRGKKPENLLYSHHWSKASNR